MMEEIAPIRPKQDLLDSNRDIISQKVEKKPIERRRKLLKRDKTEPEVIHEQPVSVNASIPNFQQREIED